MAIISLDDAENYVLRAQPSDHDTIRQVMSQLLSSGAFADVELFASDGQKAASAHQPLLCAISPVLKGILMEEPFCLHSLMLGAPPIAVHFPDAETRVVQALVALLYTGECKVPDIDILAPLRDFAKSLGINLSQLLVDVEEGISDVPRRSTVSPKKKSTPKKKSALNKVQKTQSSTKIKTAKKKTKAKKSRAKSMKSAASSTTPAPEKPSAKCVRCLLKFDKPIKFKEHVVTHYRDELVAKHDLEGKTTCPLCWNKYKGNSGLFRHVGVTHNRLEELLNDEDLKEFRNFAPLGRGRHPKVGLSDHTYSAEEEIEDEEEESEDEIETTRDEEDLENNKEEGTKDDDDADADDYDEDEEEELDDGDDDENDEDTSWTPHGHSRS